MDVSASPRYMVNGATQLQFNLYRVNVATGVWGARGNAGDSLCGSGWSALDLVHQIDSSPDSSGNYSTTVTAYGRIFSGQTTLASGTYTSSFASGGSSRAVATYTTANTNCNVLTANATDFPFTATATVVPTCRVTASDLNFGTETLLASDLFGTSTVSVTCTSGHNYSVALDDGTTAGGTTSTRLMKHVSSASTIPYEMYSDAARTLNWGESIAEDVEGTGTGAGVDHTVYGRVPAQAVAPEVGSYSDTVTVTVTY